MYLPADGRPRLRLGPLSYHQFGSTERNTITDLCLGADIVISAQRLCIGDSIKTN